MLTGREMEPEREVRKHTHRMESPTCTPEEFQCRNERLCKPSRFRYLDNSQEVMAKKSSILRSDKNPVKEVYKI